MNKPLIKVGSQIISMNACNEINVEFNLKCGKVTQHRKMEEQHKVATTNSLMNNSKKNQVFRPGKRDILRTNNWYNILCMHSYITYRYILYISIYISFCLYDVYISFLIMKVLFSLTGKTQQTTAKYHTRNEQEKVDFGCVSSSVLVKRY